MIIINQNPLYNYPNANFKSQSSLHKIPQTDTITLNNKKEKTSNRNIALVSAATALLGAGLVYFTKGKIKPKKSTIEETKVNEIIKETIESFKTKGKFDKDKALLNNGTPFTGELTHTTKDGSQIVMEYQNGILQSSKKIKDKQEIYSKLYTKHTDGNNYVTITKNGNTECINITGNINLVKNDQSKLKELLGNNENLTSEEFLKQADNIKYKNKKQKEEIEGIAGAKKYFEDEANELKKQKEAIRISNYRNERWLDVEYLEKESEYSDWWLKELEIKERPAIEARKKKIEQIDKEIKAELEKFYEENRNNLPSYEERLKLIGTDALTEYGSCYIDSLNLMRRTAKDDEFFLKYILPEPKKITDLRFKRALLEMTPDERYFYDEAVKQLKARNIKFDEYELTMVDSDTLKSIAKGKFSDCGYVLEHHHAYQVNGILRYGSGSKDTLTAILDEGFRTVAPLEQEEVVYRAVCGSSEDGSINFINQLVDSKIGDTFIDKGYSYSSFYKGAAQSCNGSWDIGTPEIKMTIHVPKGARVSNGINRTKQSEMLFPRNSKFRIVSKEKREKVHDWEKNMNDVWDITVEYVVP